MSSRAVRIRFLKLQQDLIEMLDLDGSQPSKNPNLYLVGNSIAMKIGAEIDSSEMIFIFGLEGIEDPEKSEDWLMLQGNFLRGIFSSTNDLAKAITLINKL